MNSQGNGKMNKKAYLVGGGIGSMAAAAFMIRDGKMRGSDITILEAAAVPGGSLDGCGNPEQGYSMRGGRMLTFDNYECTWDLFKSIPSLTAKNKSVLDETIEFNELYRSASKARLVDRWRGKVPVTSMGFSMEDRAELLKLSNADEDMLGSSNITDWLSPPFFETAFWYMWSTTFAFQPWHSAVEFKRYLHRFMLEFTRIETLGGVKRTIFNQYDSLVRPLHDWLAAEGVCFAMDCTVTDFGHEMVDDMFVVTAIRCRRQGMAEVIEVRQGDLVFFQNGSMTDASSLGSMTSAPGPLSKIDSGGWKLWEKLALGRPEFGNPAVFNSCIAQSSWESFTVTLKDPAFFRSMKDFSGNQAGTGGLVTFKDSSWLLSVVLPHQPHFPGQPEDVQVFWDMPCFRTGWEILSPSPWLIATARKSFASCAGTCASTLVRSLKRFAFLAACPTSPACSCRAHTATGRCQSREIPKTWLLSASSLKLQTMSFSPSSILCGLRRWRSTSCFASTARCLPLRRTTSRRWSCLKP